MSTVLVVIAIFCGLVRVVEPALAPSQWILEIKELLQDCPVETAKSAIPISVKFVEAMADCARERALVAIDHILEDDVIPLANGLELVKLRKLGASVSLAENGTITYFIRNLLSRVREKQEQLEDNELSWQERLRSRLSRVLRSHVVEIDFERLMMRGSSAATPPNAGRAANEQLIEPRGKARRRRRRQMQMMPIVMMGVLLMGSVLIPMGFQFLAVLGGKALILAKMALMLSSIQGLKKIATNGVNYGLYHTPVPEAWHERSTGYHEIPYSYETVYDSTAGHLSHPSGYIDSLGTVFARRSSVHPT